MINNELNNTYISKIVEDNVFSEHLSILREKKVLLDEYVPQKVLNRGTNRNRRIVMQKKNKIIVYLANNT